MVTQVLQTGMSFGIGSLGSGELNQLFHEASSYVPGLAVEIVQDRGIPHRIEENMAVLVGIGGPKPTIRFLDTLETEEQIEAIAHELAHLLLIHRFGLRLIRLKRAHPGDPEQKRFTHISHNVFSLLGQIGNTAHHLILIDYLRERHGIGSDIHCHLLHHHFLLFCYQSHILANEAREDMESFYGEGIIAFEYGKILGRLDGVLNLPNQTNFFRDAVRSAKKHFGKYCLEALPTPSSYEEDLLSLLRDLGYQRDDFVFFP
jgi:hypothetical protein